MPQLSQSEAEGLETSWGATSPLEDRGSWIPKAEKKAAAVTAEETGAPTRNKNICASPSALLRVGPPLCSDRLGLDREETYKIF